MNSFKATCMRLNLIRLIDLKIKINFIKFRILRLCSDLSFIMNYRKDSKYCIINIKVDKSYHAIDDTMKKNYFLNKI